ncbi:MAG: hypothetical protein HFK09_00270 [Clostridia bacterium]|nr:hypothetical protein [Clostridia bacterium]
MSESRNNKEIGEKEVESPCETKIKDNSVSEESAERPAPEESNVREKLSGEVSDPFAGYDAPKKVETEKPDKRFKKAEKQSARIAYAAAGTAIAIIASVITVYLPVRIMPLVLAAFCFFLVHTKCGAVYGSVSAVATVLVTGLCGGICSSLVLLAVCFFPYSLVCIPLRRFDYRSVKGALLRAAVSIVLVNIAFVVVYFVAKYTVLGGIDVMEAVGKLGYIIIALVISAVAVITDVLFVLCDKVITPKIK